MIGFSSYLCNSFCSPSLGEVGDMQRQQQSRMWIHLCRFKLNYLWRSKLNWKLLTILINRLSATWRRRAGSPLPGFLSTWSLTTTSSGPSSMVFQHTESSGALDQRIQSFWSFPAWLDPMPLLFSRQPRFSARLRDLAFSAENMFIDVLAGPFQLNYQMIQITLIHLISTILKDIVQISPSFNATT